MMKRKRLKRRIHHCACPECQAHPHSETAKQHRAINRVASALDERSRRHFVGLLAFQWGHGGIRRFNQVTGLSRNTILRGKREITRGRPKAVRSIRRSGGGRLPVEKNSRG